jgi:hypothetical protein
MKAEQKVPERFVTDYSLWGTALDIDRLLAAARPRAKHEVWRRGDPNPLGGGSMTAGVSIPVFCGSSESGLHRAVERFLQREARFLSAARRRVKAGVHSGLSTFISIGAHEEIPVGLELPASLLRIVSKAGISWTTTASVFYKESGADLGGGGAVQQGDEADER